MSYRKYTWKIAKNWNPIDIGLLPPREDGPGYVAESWLEDNLEDNWYYDAADETLYFKSINDVILFKLTWMYEDNEED